jgi:hypothetical protein
VKKVGEKWTPHGRIDFYNYEQEMRVPLGYAARANEQRRAEWLARIRRHRMFAPLVKTTGEVIFVAPPSIRFMESGPDLPEESGLAPDGKPWPTTVIHWNGNEPSITVKGTPSMILNAWFGAPEQQPHRKILTVPPGSRIVQ